MQSQIPKKEESWKMFNLISKRYDLVNRMMSFGMDQLWRRRLVGLLPDGESLRVLDLATGTGDVAIMLGQSESVSRVDAVDLAEDMMAIGKQKVSELGLSETIKFSHGDAMDLPFDDGSMDAVSISFGIRNVADLSLAFNEIKRVLKPGGRFLILESSIPGFFLMRWAHLFYLRWVMPLLGGLISGDFRAYRYLNVTIEGFPYGDAFCELLAQSGFINVRCQPQCFGAASLYVADIGR